MIIWPSCCGSKNDIPKRNRRVANRWLWSKKLRTRRILFFARVYCTWSSHYEHDGVDQDEGGSGPVDEGSNGFDDPVDAAGKHYRSSSPPSIAPNGVVDEPDEMETSPPYPVPLRGIQIKIRVFEPDSRQIREVTVVQDFLPK